MKQLPTLYKKSSKGKTQIWTMCIDGDTYFSHYGEKGGKIQSDTPTKAKAKNIGKSNETSPEEQALLEAQAKYKKKLEKGYKEAEEDIETFLFDVMLAQDSKKHSEKLKGKICELSRKLDGVRCYITKDGAFSRSHKKFVTTKYIEKDLEGFFKKFPDAILDGELYNHNYHDNFNHIIKLVRLTKNISPEDWDTIARELEFHIFDFPVLSNTESFETAAIDRHKRLVHIPKSPRLKLLEKKFIVFEGLKDEAVEDFYSKALEEGYEGVMIRSAESFYEMKRSYNLQKHKSFITEEFKILDIIEGEGNRTGMMGYLILELPSGGTFKANARGDEKFYKELLTNKNQYIGKAATHRFMNWTPAGVPRGGAVISIRDYE